MTGTQIRWRAASTSVVRCCSLVAVSLSAQQSAPKFAADFDASFLKLNYQMNLGEVLGVAVNSKGTIVVLNHPGSATTGRSMETRQRSCWNSIPVANSRGS
jgi:hypothetical protein